MGKSLCPNQGLAPGFQTGVGGKDEETIEVSDDSEAAGHVRRNLAGRQRKYNFHPGFGCSRPGPDAKIPGAHPIGTRLKEKDTKMNGPARITAFAVTLAGMVLAMSGCDQLA